MSSPLARARARVTGVAANPAAPAEVLLRLLQPGDDRWSDALFSERGELPGAVYDAVVAHPGTEVRAAFATGWRIPAAQRSRLVMDLSPHVRTMLATGGRPHREPVEELPAEVFARLARDPNPVVRAAIAAEVAIGDDALELLCADPDARVRRIAIETWPEPSDAVIERLRGDEDARVRRAALWHAGMRDGAAAAEFLADPETLSRPRERLIEEAPLPFAVYERLARDQAPLVRKAVAANPGLSAHLVDRLAVDPDKRVRLAVSMRAELTERQRAAVDVHVTRSDRFDPPAWARQNLDHPDLMRMCATSAHIGLRRAAAHSSSLPPDLVVLLSADADHAVRLLLCENHPGVAPEVLLSTYLEAKALTRGDLLHKPGFPREGLADRFSTDPDPERRWLAVLDPAVTATRLIRLSADPDELVRAAAAPHERLPAERARALLDDPVRMVARAAARHPGLPVDVMHRLLDDAQIPRSTPPPPG
ncbi:hypothetical protein [Phytomonospora endophytica]|uniref:Leucine rich repeat variant n=1 Tax=Phytomonospora endophytica TaxID=714109 RepID=A0A841FZZ1_9ACTN|nr:hypothetical protein [Phytomonospora endophytica]MBB6038967.1 hypothetical protein [Phytomonospora endophytica]GIG67929.1 hypothetical protein Pen01_42240 [Phytomonospora endophytica]